jgi:hypothetical protein
MLRTFLVLGLVLTWPRPSDALPAAPDAAHTHQIGLGGTYTWLVDSRDQPQPDSFEVSIDHELGEDISFHSQGLSETESSPVPLAKAQASIFGTGCPSCGGGASLASYADVRARLEYFVDVIGPASQQGTVLVPLLATCSLSADLDWDNKAPNSSTWAAAEVTYMYDADGNGAGNFTGAQSAEVRTPSYLLPDSVSDVVDHTIMVPVPAGGFGTMRTATLAHLMIHVDMGSGPGATPAASWQASALADPFVRIDPTWAHADQYELDFSPGIGNQVVPEPAAELLLISGAATLICLSRVTSARRRPDTK